MRIPSLFLPYLIRPQQDGRDGGHWTTCSRHLNRRLPYANDEWDRCTPSDKNEKHSAFPAAKTKNSRHIPTISLGAAPQRKSSRETEEVCSTLEPRIHIIRFPTQSLQYAWAPPRLPSTVPLFSQSENQNLDGLPKPN